MKLTRRRRLVSRRPRSRGRISRRHALASALLVAALALLSAPAPASAVDFYPIDGSGSSWSANAIERWISNLKANGIVVNYNPLGSTAGRTNFKSGQDDFSVSEIPYGVTPGEFPPARTFSYMPIVAGGTALQYQLRVGTQKVTDLRLAGDTIAKIFTGVITNWNDPAITRDYGRALPDKKIIPVVRSDGSGTSAQFTRYLSKTSAAVWNPFCAAHLGTFCEFTSNYPQFPGVKALAGSDGVSNFVHASYGDGAIGYVEYSYALEKQDPVVKVLNSNGFYVLPTASNVAVALTAVQFNADQTQKLDNVYTNPDPRTYPLSSYSYAIVPSGTTATGGIRVEEGATLSRFLQYALCQGQSYVANIGYSPLPRPLVENGLGAIGRIPGAQVENIDINQCDNPTFKAGRNTLLDTAPFPPACDKIGAAPCGGGAAAGPGPAGGAANPKSPTGTTASKATTAAGATTPGAAGQVGANGQPLTGGTAVDPATGELLAADGGDAATGTVLGSASNVATLRDDALTNVLYAIAALALLATCFGPPLLSRRLARRAEGTPGHDPGS